jgi:hypothetical protein
MSNWGYPLENRNQDYGHASYIIGCELEPIVKRRNSLARFSNDVVQVESVLFSTLRCAALRSRSLCIVAARCKRHTKSALLGFYARQAL